MTVKAKKIKIEKKKKAAVKSLAKPKPAKPARKASVLKPKARIALKSTKPKEIKAAAAERKPEFDRKKDIPFIQTRLPGRHVVIEKPEIPLKPVVIEPPKEKIVLPKPQAVIPPARPQPKIEKPQVQKEVKPLVVEKARPEIKKAPAVVSKPELKKAAKPVLEKKPQVVPPPVTKPVVLPSAVPAAELKELELKLPISVKDLAIRLQEKSSLVIKALMEMKVMAGINQTLDDSAAAAVCEKFGYRIKKALEEEELVLKEHRTPDRPESLKPRPPIITLMGHVDHGKTSLLDAIRKSKVVDSEHGGITQHIGAYRVNLPHGVITFLDTPGHEAFTAMRARGASVTDIVILVVAADDGVMPQTKEAIDHARAAGVSIIVAVNKIDKPGANFDRVKKQLAEFGLAAEDWGGKTITVGVSAKTGEGVDELLEMALLEAQMLELKANPQRLATGVVVEAKISKGRGPVATLLVKNGTLHLNDNILVGSHSAKVRAMFNDRSESVTSVGPAFPVEILGLSGVPEAGEEFFAIADEKTVRELAAKRQENQKQSQIKSIKRISLEDLHVQIKEGKIKELKMILKADVQGSLEAIKETLGKIDTTEIKMDFIHEGVGNINYSDVILAVASNALILGFNVVADDRAKELAARESIEIKIYNIIYELANEIKAALEGMLEPKLKKIFLGKAEVRKVFKLSRHGTVAGCIVSKGKILRSNTVSLVRNGETVFEGSISNLKRFKDDVREVAEGFECGISLAGFENIQEGDSIEAYGVEKIARKL